MKKGRILVVALIGLLMAGGLIGTACDSGGGGGSSGGGSGSGDGGSSSSSSCPSKASCYLEAWLH